MKKFFDLDSPLVRCLNRMTDLMVLNVIFLLTCIPIITIGAAWTALSYVALKMARNEEAYIIKDYFRSMRQNFRQATVLWAGMFGMGVVLFLDFSMMQGMGGYGLVRKLLAGICLVFWIMALYLFPMLARFDNTLRAAVNNALVMAARHPRCTLAMLAVTGAGAGLTLLTNGTVIYGIPFWILIGFAFISYVNAQFLRRVFDQYEERERN